MSENSTEPESTNFSRTFGNYYKIDEIRLNQVFVGFLLVYFFSQDAFSVSLLGDYDLKGELLKV